MKRTMAAVAATTLTLGIGIGLAGASTAVADGSSAVDVMPGAVNVHQALVTDDTVYAVSSEPGRGNEIFSRTLEATETGTTLGAATRVTRASGTPLAEHDGTLAYVEQTGGQLALRAPDGTVERPAWGAHANFASYGPSAITADWVASGDQLFSRATGARHNLRSVPVVTPEGAPVELPTEVGVPWVTGVAISDTRAVWSVYAVSGSPSFTTYQAIVTVELGASGPVGPAVRLDSAVYSQNSGDPGQLGVAGLIDGTTPVWTRTGMTTGQVSEVRWQDAPFTGAPSSYALGTDLFASAWDLDGSTVALTVTTYGDETWGQEIVWVDLAGEGSVVREKEYAGYVLEVAGPYVVSKNDDLTTWLDDARGLPFTADVTLPPAVVRFGDVGLDHPFHGDIDWLAVNRIADGYQDGGFHPTAPVSRQAMAAFLYRTAGMPHPDPMPTTRFPDVATGDAFEYPILWLVSEEITGGYADGTFRPTAPVSRQAMAAFLYRYAGSPEVTVDGAPFPDVPAGSEFAAAITWLAGTGITGGYDDGTFRPTAPVSRQAMAAFLHRFVDKGFVPVELT